MSDDLMQKFSGLVDMAEGGLQSKVHEQALRIQAQAKELCPVRRYGSGGGSLRQSIHPQCAYLREHPKFREIIDKYKNK